MGISSLMAVACSSTPTDPLSRIDGGSGQEDDLPEVGLHPALRERRTGRFDAPFPSARARIVTLL